MKNYINNRKEFIISEIKEANCFFSNDKLKEEKYSLLKVSPFNFFRGTVHLFYKDISNNIIKFPQSWINDEDLKTWICGDMHTQNFGFIQNGNNEVIFDINDFDNAYIGPFYFDILRYLCSLLLFADEIPIKNFDKKFIKITRTFLKNYFAFIKTKNKEEISEQSLNGILLKKYFKLLKRRNKIKHLKKWTTEKNGNLIFNFNNKNFASVEKIEKNTLKKNIHEYLESINIKINSNQKENTVKYEVADIAFRLNAGIDSIGRKRYYILLRNIKGEPYDYEIVEAKEQLLPVIAKVDFRDLAVYKKKYKSDAKRTETAVYNMLLNPCLFTGYFKTDKSSFFVTLLSPYKFKFKALQLKKISDLKCIVKFSAIAAAMAHSRNFYQKEGFNLFVKNALSLSTQKFSFEQIITNLAYSYYKQVQEDYSFFCNAKMSDLL